LFFFYKVTKLLTKNTNETNFKAKDIYEKKTKILKVTKL